MATPIKPTPMLFGEDARRFEERMNTPRHVSQETIIRMEKAYETFQKIYVG